VASFSRLLLAPITITLAWLVMGASWLAYLAPYISPNWLSYLPFFGLFYPIWLTMQAMLLPFLFKYKKKVFVYLLLTSLAGYAHFFGNIQVVRNADKRLTAKSFTLMSYNIGGNGLDKNMKFERLWAYKTGVIQHARPNILCLQEQRYNLQPNATDPTQRLPNYPFSAAESQYGVCIFSDFPIRKSKFFALPSLPKNIAMYADIMLGDRTIRLFNVHLQSNKLGDDADNFVQELDNIDEQEGKQTYIRTFSKLRQAWQKRAAQADALADSIAQSPYPVVLCGDFNDTPSSYAYRVAGYGLQDAFRKGGRGTSFSYNGKLPAVSIDHIFVAPNYPVYGFRVVREAASDHYPVRAEIGY
jgi:endonuclease/exonuclease/phosphatase family metal-dependent hydrolase